MRQSCRVIQPGVTIRTSRGCGAALPWVGSILLPEPVRELHQGSEESASHRRLFVFMGLRLSPLRMVAY